MASLGALVIELRECLEKIREHGDAYYVYVLRRPDGTPFYVGKGRYDRVARHEYDAFKTRKKSYRLNVIRQVIAQGGRIGYEITRFHAEPADALAAEIDLIRTIGRRDLGTGPLTNKTDGGDGWMNPSPASRSRIAAFMRQRMNDPAYRERAVNAMHSSPLRAERQRLSAGRPEYRELQAALMRERWRTRRADMLAAQTASRTSEWRRKQMDGVARIQADHDFHLRRNAGRRAQIQRDSA